MSQVDYSRSFFIQNCLFHLPIFFAPDLPPSTVLAISPSLQIVQSCQLAFFHNFSHQLLFQTFPDRPVLSSVYSRSADYFSQKSHLSSIASISHLYLLLHGHDSDSKVNIGALCYLTEAISFCNLRYFLFFPNKTFLMRINIAFPLTMLFLVLLDPICLTCLSFLKYCFLNTLWLIDFFTSMLPNICTLSFPVVC